MTWPIGRGKTFAGTYHLAQNAVRRSDTETERTKVNGPDSNRVAGLLPENEREALIEELDLAREACRPFDLQAFREGHLTPVYFGSALRNYGVRDLIEAGGIDAVYAVGPVPMMRAVSELTRPHGIPTTVSLNAIMVDGTGMCGGCRVSVDGENRYACVEGPEFDGHLVDFKPGAAIPPLMQLTVSSDGPNRYCVET